MTYQNGNIKYRGRGRHSLANDTLAEEIDKHLTIIYNLFKTVHPDWSAMLFAVGDRDEEYVTFIAEVIDQKTFGSLCKIHEEQGAVLEEEADGKTKENQA